MKRKKITWVYILLVSIGGEIWLRYYPYIGDLIKIKKKKVGDLIDISPIDWWLLLRFAKEIIRKSSNNLIKQKKKTIWSCNANGTI